MNLHPLVVHYPIALLTTYALFELFSIRRVARRPYWFYIKAILVTLGALGALGAYLSGGSLVGTEPSALAAQHGKFALATLILSALIALVYLAVWFGKEKVQELSWALLANRGAMIPLALACLALIVITGGLGGAMIYGTDFDPFMKPIFQLLGVY